MLDGSDVRWAILGHNGRVSSGVGCGNGLGGIWRGAKAGVLLAPPLVPLICVGETSLIWCVDKFMDGSNERRAWGLSCPEGHRIWIDSARRWIGIAPELDDAEAILQEMSGKIGFL